MSSPSSSSRAGSHRGGSSSLSALVSTLVPCIVVAGVLVGGFLLLRNKQRKLYAARTYHDALGKDEKTPAAGNSLMGWISNFRHLSDEYVLSHHSLDAYLYLRFLKMLVLMALVGAIITWPILFPVNATGGGGESGLDILSFSNVNNATRYFAHALVAWLFFSWVMFLIGRETIYLVKVRQAYLLSTWNASRISQRTVLFTNVPKEFLSFERLHGMFHNVAQIWLVPNVKDLEDDVDEVDETVPKLEDSEMKLIMTANKKQQKKSGEKSSHDGHRGSGANAVEPGMRPTHRLKPLIGHKVDSIGHYRSRLKKLLPVIQSAQRHHLSGKGECLSAVFVEFDTLAAAQTASALTVHHTPASFVARQMGVIPDEVIWKNLGMSSWNASGRRAIATAAIFALILFWSIPVALVGIISNVNYLTENVPFLAWIDDIPSVILGVVTGLLPTILLAALMALVPIICRFFATTAGAVTLSEVELQTQTWYFAFQVIQVFLVTTFTSGATAVASQIVSNPAQAVPLLAKNLPKASNFYIAYFILFGVANSARYLFNLIGLLGAFVLSKFAKTPRKKYNRYMQFMEPSWGAEYPKWTNLGVIAISYAVIAPLILGFATVGLGLIYVAYRYNMLYVYNTNIDTKGAFYARALEQLMVGVYLAEVCLLGLFGIGIGNEISAVGPVVLQIILIVATIIFHLVLKRKLKPLIEVLPLDLLSETEQKSHDDAERGIKVEEGTKGDYDQHDGSSPSALVSTISRDRNNGHHTHAATNDLVNDSTSPPQQTFFKRIFTPHQVTASQISASLAPRFRQPVAPYAEQEVLEAYLHPALVQREPVIWLARDPLGISAKEMAELRDSVGRVGVEVTDEGAVVSEKGKVEWVSESVREAPLWDRKTVY